MSLMAWICRKLGLTAESRQSHVQTQFLPVRQIDLPFHEVDINMRVKYQGRWWWKFSSCEVMDLSQNFGNRVPMHPDAIVTIVVEGTLF